MGTEAPEISRAVHVVASQVRDTSPIIVARQTDTLNVKFVPGSRTKRHLFICSNDGRCNLLDFVVVMTVVGWVVKGFEVVDRVVDFIPVDDRVVNFEVVGMVEVVGFGVCIKDRCICRICDTFF